MLSDYIGEYMVKKQGDVAVDTDGMINSIIAYVQNHDVYFEYGPRFLKGVLVFGIVGYRRDHKAFQKVAGEMLEHFNCTIEMIKMVKGVVNQEGAKMPTTK